MSQPPRRGPARDPRPEQDASAGPVRPPAPPPFDPPHLPEPLRELALAYLRPLSHELDPLLPAADVGPAFRFDPRAAVGPPRSHGPLPPPPPPTPVPAPTPESLPWLPLVDLVRLIRRGEVTPTEAVQAYARRIAALDPTLHAFITPTLPQALAEAEHPRAGRLSGVPLGLKDIIDVAGVRTTAGSRLYAEHIAPKDSAVWERLRGEGAVLLGKLHTHEFAAGATGENEAYGSARNPWDVTRMTGGSSSGAGAAVAAALVAAAIGTDTGGSIRVPAALCGVVGFKPTYGVVPVDGVVPLSWSLDHVGPLTRTVRDAALLFDVLAGDAEDGAERAARAGGGGDLHGVRIGVPAAWLSTGLAPEVDTAFAESLHVLREAGAEIQEITLPATAERLMAVNRAIALAEASAWHEPFLTSDRAALYGANVRPRKEAGRLIPATLYLKAQRLRSELCAAFARTVWAVVDVLALPTVPIPAPRLGEGEVDLAGRTAPVTGALLGWVGPFNVLGGPAVSVPMALGPSGLPTALQLAGIPGDDAFLLYVAAAFEARRPKEVAFHPPDPPTTSFA